MNSKTKSTKQESKIKAVRVYQAVTFDKRNETFFSIMPIPNRTAPEISVHYDKQVVEVKSSTDHVFIPFANVSGIYMFTDSDQQRLDFRESESKKKSKVAAADIRRPN